MKTIKTKSKAWSVSSMVTGILGIVLVPMPYFAMPLSILAIVFRSKDKESSMSTAGLVCGIIGIVINAICLMILAFSLIIVSMWGI